MRQQTTSWRQLLAQPILLLWMCMVAGMPLAGATDQTVPPADSTLTGVAMTVEPVRPNYPGEPLTISAVLQDSNNSEAEYQFLIDGVVIQPWSHSASYQWIPALQDIGKHQLDVQVRSGKRMITQQDSIYIYRRPVRPSDYDPAAD